MKNNFLTKLSAVALAGVMALTFAPAASLTAFAADAATATEVKTVPVYRTYNGVAVNGGHNYTIDKTEADANVKAGWTNEGIAWHAPASGTTVYRMYNSNSGEHYYTTSKSERDDLVAHFWTDETKVGENVFYSANEKTGVPVYVIFNPKCKGNQAGSHHYTTSETEADGLVKAGWTYKTVAFYALPEAKASNVTSVVATNATTLTAAGVDLDDIKAADVTVDGVKVSSVTAAADGKTMTIALGDNLEEDKEYKVTIKTSKGDKTFKVTYKAAAVSKLEIEDQTVDYKTSGQRIAFKFNGKTATADDLIKEGYEVTFTAVPSNNTAKTVAAPKGALFKAVGTAGETQTSTTGDVFYDATGAEALTIGAIYKVSVTLQKKGEIYTSDSAKVTVINNKAAAESILEVDKANENLAVKNSTVLVVGEEDTISEMDVKVNDKEKVLNKDNIIAAIEAGTVKITSSNDAIVSVNNANAKLKGESIGTATITYEYGSAKKTETYTVKNATTDGRAPKKVVFNGSYVASKTTTVAKTSDFTKISASVVDQYGDVLKATDAETPTDLKLTFTTDADGLTLSAGATGSEIASGKVDVTAAITKSIKSAVIKVKYGSTSLGYLTLTVNVAGESSFGVTQLGANSDSAAYATAANVDGSSANYTKYDVSKDTTLDTYKDSVAVFEVYNVDAKGNKVDAGTTAVDLTNGWTIDNGDSSVLAIGEPSGDENILVIKALKPSKTPVTVKLTNGTFTKSFNFTTASSAPVIKSANFKAVTTITKKGTTLSAADIFNFKNADTDPVVDMTMSGTTSGLLRISSTDANTIYVDVDGDGTYTPAKDLAVGTITVAKSSNSTGSAIATFVTDAANILDPAAVYTAGAGDEGTIIVNVTNTKGDVFTNLIKIAVE